MSRWLAVTLPAAALSGAPEIVRTDGLPSFSALTLCERSSPEEVVICGRRQDRYRLPLPTEKNGPAERVRGEAPSGTAALTPPRPCGIFAGERQCGKKEAAAYGYGNGRDPITVLGRLAGKLVDPDAD